jgi:DnaJ-class molecular chaperone
MKLTLKKDKMTEAGSMNDDINVEIDNDEFFDAFIETLHDQCEECNGCGEVDEFFNKKNVTRICYVCKGEGKKINYNAEKFFQLIKNNIKLEIR